MPTQISLPVVDWNRSDLPIQFLYEVRLGDIDVARAAQTDATEVRIPVETRGQFLQLCEGRLVINILGIAPLHAIHRCLCQLSLYGHHGLGVGLRSSRVVVS